jgi:putative membrane protein
VLTLVNAVFPNHIPVPILIPILIVVPLAFALLHGAVRYHWSGILIFLVMCLVVSNVLENTSILTGFPFGHYYYTSGLGPKLFLVPLLIGPAYFGTGYLAWVLSTVLIGDVRSKGSWFTTFAAPFIASFMMVAWDLGMDPTSSTIRHLWIWEQGGGYFGVPLTNYLGWFFTVYVFFQLFALSLRLRKASRDREELTLPRSYYAQAIVMYAVDYPFIAGIRLDRFLSMPRSVLPTKRKLGMATLKRCSNFPQINLNRPGSLILTLDTQ